MMRNPRRQSGYSLLELMISLAIMAIVISQVLLAFSSQNDNFEKQVRVIESQQDVRTLADAILSDLRMAGYMLSTELAVGSIDGGAGASDLICMSDPSVINPVQAESAPEPFYGAEVLTNITGDDSSVIVTAGDLDIDDDGDDDFTASNGGIIISDGLRVHCAEITGVNTSTNTISFSPATPSGVSFQQFETRAAPAIVYRVNGTTLTRNGIKLSSYVEDLQIQLGVDDDGDGQLEAGEFPLDDISTGALDLTKTRIARIFVTGRESRGSDEFVGQRTLAANRTAGGNDQLKRRRVTADAVLRNAR